MNQPRCPVDIEFGDVQGNILTAYGKFGFPFGRFDSRCGRVELMTDRSVI